MKNSEWGAVAYLTQSSYGRDGAEPNINNLNLNNKDGKWIYAVTGFAGIGQSTVAETNIVNVHGHKTETGVLASSTGNITGIYDLNGCIWEYVAAYVTSGYVHLVTYGTPYTYTTAEADPTTRSTKYATAYPYIITGTRYGDAVRETSSMLNLMSGWNGVSTTYPQDAYPFFVRRWSIQL